MLLFIEFLDEGGELVGDGDSKDSNNDSVEKEGNESVSKRQIRLHNRVNKFLDDVVPHERCDQSEAGGGKREHLGKDDAMEAVFSCMVLVCFVWHRHLLYTRR